MGDRLERVIELAAGAADALRARVDELAHLRAELEALAGTVCVGVEYWRRENGKPDRLYLNHGTDAACPLHGTPAPGGRLRCYVGSDSDRIAEARAAIERETQRADLERQAQTIWQGLVDCGQPLQAFYSSLVGDLPEDSKEAFKEEKRTSIERAIAEALDWSGIGHWQQYRFDGSPWTFDEFVPPDVLIEAQGDYWHNLEKVRNRDARKAAWARENGYRLVTIWEHEIKTEGARVLIAERVLPFLRA